MTARKRKELVEDLLQQELKNPGGLDALLRTYEFSARPKQKIPDPEPRILCIQAGRGWGKTWTGAHWIRQQIERGCKQLLAVGPTATDVHDIMVPMLTEVMPGSVYRRALDAPSVTYQGAIVHLRSGQRVDRCRGLNIGACWTDEIDSWTPETYQPKEAWLAVIEPACRLSPAKFLITSTPKRGGIIAWFTTRADVQVVKGHTRENEENLAPGVVNSLIAAFAGSWLERQELAGEIVDDIEGSLVLRRMIDEARLSLPPTLKRVMIGVDPSGGTGTQGIVAVGIDDQRPAHFYVLEDASCCLPPDGWGRKVINCFTTWDADRIIVEKNYGGELLKSTLETIEKGLPVKYVSATRGKHIRFEPIAALYAQGRAHHIGSMPKLEDQITAFTAKGYEGGSSSPDRADALVWACSELLGRRGPSPSDLYSPQEGLLSRTFGLRQL